MDIKLIRQRRLEFLEEGVKYFLTDTRRRAVKSFNSFGTRCMYRTSSRVNCKKCFIGRHIPDRQYFTGLEGSSVTSKLLYVLPPDIQELGLGFLQSCQHLHDQERFWNKRSGMTELGKSEVSKIRERINKNMYELS